MILFIFLMLSVCMLRVFYLDNTQGLLFNELEIFDKISSFQTDHRPATRLLKILHADECHCFKPKRPNERFGGIGAWQKFLCLHLL